MKCLILFILCATFVVLIQCQCSRIYEWGMSQNSKDVVVNAHNRYRNMIRNGQVPGQPRGKNILMINGFDERLSVEARKVSRTCQMSHIRGTDARWTTQPGQNLYISWSSVNTPGADWEAAVASWFSEHEYFTYPSTSRGVTGHYTQVIWHDSNTLGCDFIRFYDGNQPKYPYAKLYTCNYGPTGNWIGQAPYQLA